MQRTYTTLKSPPKKGDRATAIIHATVYIRYPTKQNILNTKGLPYLMLLISTHCIWHMLGNMNLHDKGTAGGERLKQGVTDTEFEAKGS